MAYYHSKFNIFFLFKVSQATEFNAQQTECVKHPVNFFKQQEINTNLTENLLASHEK